MLGFILRRLLALPLVILAVTALIVLLMQFLSPAQRAAAYVGGENQLRDVDKIVEQYGLDRPFYVQYWNWLKNAAHGNLGYSRASAQPVLQTLKDRFPATLELALYASLPIVAFGLWLGTVAALNKDKPIDQVARLLAVVGYSLPSFVLGIWLLVLFYGGLSILPGVGNLSQEGTLQLMLSGVRRYTGLLTVDSLLNGRLDLFWDALRHLILPSLTLTAISSAAILKATRSSMLGALSEDYVRTARSKGLPEKTVNLKHARRNAMLTVATFAGFIVAGLLNGALITETIFAYPGIGSWGAQAATILDYAGVMGFATFTAVIVVLSNLVVDLMYGLLDPRVRYS